MQTISLEEVRCRLQACLIPQFLETERHKLGPNLTPVTPESFAKWKQTRLDAKSASEDAERKAKAATANANKAAGLSGRDMYVSRSYVQLLNRAGSLSVRRLVVS